MQQGISDTSVSANAKTPDPIPMTFGEKLVGLTFNPSGNLRVQRAKELCAELADLVQDDILIRGGMSPMYDTLVNHTICEILNAQMNIVKILTLQP